MSTKPWLMLIESENEKFDQRMDATAEQYRREVVIPLCVAFNFRFWSGMGDYYFYRGNIRIGSKQEAIERGYLEIALAFDVLDADAGRHPFGYRVSDVTTKDKRKARA